MVRLKTALTITADRTRKRHDIRMPLRRSKKKQNAKKITESARLHRALVQASRLQCAQLVPGLSGMVQAVTGKSRTAPDRTEKDPGHAQPGAAFADCCRSTRCGSNVPLRPPPGKTNSQKSWRYPAFERPAAVSARSFLPWDHPAVPQQPMHTRHGRNRAFDATIRIFAAGGESLSVLSHPPKSRIKKRPGRGPRKNAPSFPAPAQSPHAGAAASSRGSFPYPTLPAPLLQARP